MPRVLIGSIAESRVSISRAALLVNVTARIADGLTCPVWMRYAMRVVRTRVLPLPALARQGDGAMLLGIQVCEDAGHRGEDLVPGPIFLEIRARHRRFPKKEGRP